MTVALLHPQFRSLPTCRKRLQIKKIKDGASKTSIGEQSAPAGMQAVARTRYASARRLAEFRTVRAVQRRRGARKNSDEHDEQAQDGMESCRRPSHWNPPH